MRSVSNTNSHRIRTAKDLTCALTLAPCFSMLVILAMLPGCSSCGDATSSNNFENAANADMSAAQDMSAASDMTSGPNQVTVDMSIQDMRADMMSPQDMTSRDMASQEDMPAEFDMRFPPYALFCQGGGSIGGSITCGGELAQRTFRYGLCICRDVAISSTISIDGFNSNNGAYMEGIPGGSLGINGNYNGNDVSVGASLWVGGQISGSGSLDVGVNMNVGGQINTSGNVNVGRDANVNGNILIAGDLAVDGELVQPTGSQITSQSRMLGSQREAPVSFPAPCDCEDEQLIDVAAYIAEARDHNDNDEMGVGIQPGMFQNLTQDTELDLPCGRFYFTDIQGSGSLVLRLEGRTAIYIDGNISLGQSFEIELGPEATLDLFIGGTITTSGRFAIGDPMRPVATRVYMGGTGTLNFSGDVSIAANLYAPRGEFAVSSGIELFGSVLASRLNTSGDVIIHYDSAVLQAGEECEMDPPDPMPGEDMSGMMPGEDMSMVPPEEEVCDSCRDCGNQACGEDGECGACETQYDCCSPLICFEGECIEYPG